MSAGLKPFFCYYGGKWKIAPRYPAPRYRRIIEPFAGAAGYAVRHHMSDVVLVERDPIIATLWRWLIGVDAGDVLRLPLEIPAEGTNAMDLCDGARILIGFWLNKGVAAPRKKPCAWMRSGIRHKSYWGPEIRARISAQVEGIRHWTIIEGDYSESPDGLATRFVDPPYFAAGRHYRYSEVNYMELGAWCRDQPGQTIVCEAQGATWLPFSPIGDMHSIRTSTRRGATDEAIYTMEKTP